MQLENVSDVHGADVGHDAAAAFVQARIDLRRATTRQLLWYHPVRELSLSPGLELVLCRIREEGDVGDVALAVWEVQKLL